MTMTIPALTAQNIAVTAVSGRRAEDQAKHAADWARAISTHMAYAETGRTDSYRLLQLGQVRDASAAMRRHLIAALAALDETDQMLDGMGGA